MPREHPIVFSGAMIPLLLDQSKHQTLRLSGLEVLNEKPDRWEILCRDERGVFWFRDSAGVSPDLAVPCPYGQEGDRLWVRENLKRLPDGTWIYAAPDHSPVLVNAKDAAAMIAWSHHKQQNYCPSIHMPRWASRMTLELEVVSIHRVQSISEGDAIREDLQKRDDGFYPGKWGGGLSRAVDSYQTLWDSLNGKTHPWESNPWVWRLAFVE